MRLYTRSGDQGETGLFGGRRVSKAHRRVGAVGEVDELNSLLGWAQAAVADRQVQDLLVKLQTELFILGADLATPEPDLEASDQALRVGEERVVGLEELIDRLQQEIPPLRYFILPGGTEAAGRLHVARAVCRRAERSVVALAQEEPINPHTVCYLNRLADLLFVLARVVNRRAGEEESPWQGTEPQEPESG